MQLLLTVYDTSHFVLIQLVYCVHTEMYIEHNVYRYNHIRYSVCFSQQVVAESLLTWHIQRTAG